MENPASQIPLIQHLFEFSLLAHKIQMHTLEFLEKCRHYRSQMVFRLAFPALCQRLPGLYSIRGLPQWEAWSLHWSVGSTLPVDVMYIMWGRVAVYSTLGGFDGLLGMCIMHFSVCVSTTYSFPRVKLYCWIIHANSYGFAVSCTDFSYLYGLTGVGEFPYGFFYSRNH